jgi:predicted PurR-regulated permease PerM
MKGSITKRDRRYWLIFGGISTILLMYMIFPFIDVILYGLFLYYITRPIYELINDRIRNKNISASLSLIIFVLPVIIILAYTTIVASYELNRFLTGVDYTIPSEYLGNILKELGSLGKQLTPQEIWGLVTMNKDLTDLLTLPLASVANLGLKLFFMFTIGFYLLKDGKKLREWLIKSSLGSDNELSKRFFDSVDKDLSRVFFGNILVAMLTSVIGIVLFYVLNFFAPDHLAIPYPFLLGLLCGMAIFIPVIGIKIVLVPLYIYIIAQAWVNGILIGSIGFILISMIMVFLLVDISPDIVLRPIISSRTIHPGVMILSYLFGVLVFGFMGLFLGPMIVVAVTNFMTIVFPEIAGD